jgi:hypothetical protein
VLPRMLQNTSTGPHDRKVSNPSRSGCVRIAVPVHPEGGAKRTTVRHSQIHMPTATTTSRSSDLRIY